MKINLKKVSIVAIILFIFLSPISVEFKQTQPINNTNSSISNNKSIGSTEFSFIVNEANALEIGDCPSDGLGVCVANGILTFYELIFYTTTQFILVIVGIVTDAFIGFSISSNFYRSSGIIEAGWEILRDLTNVIFIFALITTAFKLVLGTDSSGAKKTLIKTILVALVINFSLFMSYVIIDGTNILAHVFYNKIDADVSDYSPRVSDAEGQQQDVDSGGINVASFFVENGIKKSPSIAVASQINPQRIITKSGTDNFIVAFLLVTMTAVMNIFMIWIFFNITLLFLGRVLGLIVLTILSPLAFASLTIPSMRGLSYVGWDKWFPDILKLSFMAPIYLFFLWLIITFVGNEGVLAILNQPDNANSFIDEIINVYILMALIGGMLYIAKNVTEKMAGELGNIASKVIKGAVGGTIAVAAVAATGGAAAVGMGARGVGGAANMIKKGSGAGLSKFGKRAMSFKADVTKIPGFKTIAGDTVTKFAGKATNISGRDIERKSTLGAMKGIDRLKDLKDGRKYKEDESKYEADKAKIRTESAKWQDKLDDEAAAQKLAAAQKQSPDLIKSRNELQEGEADKKFKNPVTGNTFKQEKAQVELLENILKETKKNTSEAVVAKLMTAKTASAQIKIAQDSLDTFKEKTFEGKVIEGEKNVSKKVAKEYRDGGKENTAKKIESGKIKAKTDEIESSSKGKK